MDIVNTLETECNELENWLYDDGRNAQKSAYVSKATHVRNVTQPIDTRIYEFEQMPFFFNQFHEGMKNYEMRVNTTDEAFSHITTEERAPIHEMLAHTRQWL